ncbi:MAG: dipeptidase [Pseudomonadota bacterium]
MIPVFDGHNDILWRMAVPGADRAAIWSGSEGKGHLDLPRMRKGGFAGGFFAVYISSPDMTDLDKVEEQMGAGGYSAPLPVPIPFETALPVASSELADLMWMEAQGGLRIVRTAAEIRAAMAAGDIAAILHLEGAEAIDPDLSVLPLWHAAGLRSIGPVWSRPTAFGHGVPFAFPSSPDTGDGLTEAGKRLVRACNGMRILLDTSHLNEKGFRDLAAISTAPVVATHSNAHALCPVSRNLTDAQLEIIRASKGMVGINFATTFLNPDGRKTGANGLDPLLRHLDHLIGKVGEDGVGFGSDFDGATVPDQIGDVAGLPRLLDAIAAHGLGRELVEKVAWKNWLSVLERTWGA